MHINLGWKNGSGHIWRYYFEKVMQQNAFIQLISKDDLYSVCLTESHANEASDPLFSEPAVKRKTVTAVT